MRVETTGEHKFDVIYLGAGLLLLGLLTPMLIQTRWVEAFAKLQRAVQQMDQGILILTATQVLSINALQTLPQFLGATLLAEELHRFWQPSRRHFGLWLPVVLLLVSYGLIYLIYGVTHDWFVLMVLIGLCAGISSLIRKYSPSLAERSLVTVLVLFGAHWLHVMPLLDRIGSGSDEVFAEIKHVARFMQAEPSVNFIGFMFLGFTLILIAFLIRMMSVHNNELARERLDREREQELQMMRIAALEAKAFGEVRSLSHDLKTPLTAIQGLTSVLQLMVSEQDERVAAICDRIDQAADNMNDMITDIILQERRQPINLSELLTYTTAQVSPKQGQCSIKLMVENPDSRVAGNRMRLARAVANILENALHAMAETGGEIDIEARSLPDHRVRIVITDNGPGIQEKEKRKIFEPGFSTRGTAGLGLPFASEVIRKHDGTINLWSVPGVGTKVEIYLPEVIEN